MYTWGVRGGNVHKTAASVIAIVGAFVSLHIHATPQDVDLRHAPRRGLEAIFTAAEGPLCRILHPNFREFSFHALG